MRLKRYFSNIQGLNHNFETNPTQNHHVTASSKPFSITGLSSSPPPLLGPVATTAVGMQRLQHGPLQRGYLFPI